jgi:hypothetical protein
MEIAGHGGIVGRTPTGSGCDVLMVLDRHQPWAQTRTLKKRAVQGVGAGSKPVEGPSSPGEGVMVRLIRASVAAAFLCSVLAIPVGASEPITVRIPLSDIGIVDEGWTRACGFEVRTDVTGHITLRTWQDASGNPVREVNNYAVRIRLYTAASSITTNDVGADRITYLADGSIKLVTIGKIQSLTIQGGGQVYADVGQSTFLVTFDAQGNASFELIAQRGKHDPDQARILCGILRP